MFNPFPIIGRVALAVLLTGTAAKAQSLAVSPGTQVLYEGDATGSRGVSAPGYSGPLVPSYTGLDNGGLQNGFTYALALDADGNTFFFDGQTEVVRVAASGKGPIPSVPSVAHPQKDTVYQVAGTGTGAVGANCTAPINPDGDGCAAIDAFLSNSQAISGLAVDRNGNIYIADLSGGLRVVYGGGTVPGLPSAPVRGNIYQIAPTYGIGPIAVDLNGNIYTLQQGTDGSGNAYFTVAAIYAGGTLPGISGTLTFGQSYTVLGGDTTSSCFESTSLSNCYTDLAANSASGGYPAALAVDPFGNVYVDDTSNHIVRAVYLAGTLPGIESPKAGRVYTVAGNGTMGTELTGVPALQSPLQGYTVINGNPIQMAFDGAGSVYLVIDDLAADYGFDIAKVDASGLLTTVFSGGGSSCSEALDPFGDGCPANQVSYLGAYNQVQYVTYGAQGIAVGPGGDIYYDDARLGLNGQFGLIHKIAVGGPTEYFTGSFGAIPPQVLTVYNTGAADLKITSLALNSAVFAIAPTGGPNDCTASTTLSPGASCQLGVTFTPTSVGTTDTSSLRIASNSQNATGGVNSVTFSGTASQGSTSTVLGIDPAAPMAANQGQTVALTANVAAPRAVSQTPTGTVVFTLTDSGGTQTSFTGSIVPTSDGKAGVANVSSATIASGSYTVQAAYSGDTNFNVSQSATLQLTVAPSSKPAPSVALTASSATVTSGQPLTLTATLSTAGGTPTGTVIFADGYQANSNVLGTGTLAGGVATLTTSTLPVGLNTLVAFYGGSSQFSANASAGMTVAVTSVASANLQFVPGTIATVAGQFGLPGDTGDGGPASQAEVNPTAVAFDKDGNLYLAEGNLSNGIQGSNLVRVIASGKGIIPGIAQSSIVAGHIYVVAGGGSPASGNGDGGPALQAALSNPSALFVDASGDLYIYESNDIRKVDAKTAVIGTVAGSPGNGGYGGDNGPALAAQINVSNFKVDNAGNIYFADGPDNVVRAVDARTGVITTVAGIGAACPKATLACGDGGPATGAMLNNPSDVAVDSSGDLLIADTGDNAVRRVSTAIGTISVAYSGLPGVSQIAFDQTGNLYAGITAFNVFGSPVANQLSVIEAATQNVVALAGNGQACSALGQCGDGEVATNAPINGSFVVDPSGNIYNADSGNSIVREIATSQLNLGFGAQTLVTPKSPPIVQPFQITNTGTTPLTLSGVAFSGDFQQLASASTATTPDCHQTSTVAPGAACAINVEYLPIRIGSETGSVVVTSNSANSAHAAGAATGTNTIALSGTGLALGGLTDQTITFASPGDQIYGVPFKVAAASSAGAAYPASFLVSGPATLIGDQVTPTGVGAVTITAYQTGDSNSFAPAAPVTRTIRIAPATLTVTANRLSRIFGAQNPALTYTITQNGTTTLADASATTGSAALTVTDASGNPVTATTPVGSYPIVISAGTLATASLNFAPLTAADFVNGTLSITGDLPQTIAFPAPAGSAGITYGASPIVLSATTTASGHQIVYTTSTPATAQINGSILTITGAGAVSVTATQPGDSTYLAADPVTQSFVVAKAPITISANNLTVAQNAAIPTLGYAINGLVNGDKASTVTTGDPTLTVVDAKGNALSSTATLGAYPIVIAQGALVVSSPNYALAAKPLLNGTLTVVVGSAQTIAFTQLPALIYGIGPQTLTATASSGLPVTYSLVSGPAQVVANQLSVQGAGQIVVAATQNGNATYSSATVQQTIVVNPALLTVTAQNATRTTNTQNPPFTSTITGYVNGDNASVLGGAVYYTTTATPESPAGRYPIVPQSDGQLKATNYGFTFVNGSLTVTSGGPVSDFALALSASQLIIVQGAQKQATISLTPVNFYNGSVTLTCGDLPANLVCVFSPPSVVSDGTNVATTTLTVNTSPNIVGEFRYGSRASLYVAALGPLGGLLGFALALGRRRAKSISGQWTAFLVVGALAGAIGLSACSSGKSTSGSGSNTSGYAAPGTYNLTLKATDLAGGPTHALPLTVQVK